MRTRICKNKQETGDDWQWTEVRYEWFTSICVINSSEDKWKRERELCWMLDGVSFSLCGLPFLAVTSHHSFLSPWQQLLCGLTDTCPRRVSKPWWCEMNSSCIKIKSWLASTEYLLIYTQLFIYLFAGRGAALQQYVHLRSSTPWCTKNIFKKTKSDSDGFLWIENVFKVQ